ncbi:short coiled-coil protein isoform X1 [Falco peregrinus]|uniref:short coiled-coil protein isoform X1 n=2 Tax=Falco peregrinus TaxID=8954 RepID=UPI00247A90C2|nr:short coiled-coil protein isoform X1 [Falco peregrinus]
MELPLDEEDGTFTNISLADDSDHHSGIRSSAVERAHSTMMNADMDAVEAENQVELEEKTRLINQVLELQHTLEDLSARVDAVKEENLKLKSENQVLGQYIENLMSASSVFQTTDTKSKRNLKVIRLQRCMKSLSNMNSARTMHCFLTFLHHLMASTPFRRKSSQNVAQPE